MADRESRLRRRTPQRQMSEPLPEDDAANPTGVEPGVEDFIQPNPVLNSISENKTHLIVGGTIILLLFLGISYIRESALGYSSRVVKFSDDQCNTPNDRSIWCNGTSINTDYEHIANTPPGITRKYYIELENKVICPDGYCVNATLINGTYPGPVLWGNWGDSFEITVKNLLQNCNGSSIHFHGLRQWNTTYADGVAGVTQCPIPPIEGNNTMTYFWNATQYGSSWYHSHFRAFVFVLYSLQYANGILGPLVLYGPSSTNYDFDSGPLLIGDWYHEDAFSVYYREIEAHGGGPPSSDSKLINGMGNFTTVSSTGIVSPGCDLSDPHCRPVTSIYNTTVQTGKRYKFRIVNTSVTSHLTFWIDGHDLEVISTDFVPIMPYTASNLTIAIGQRYEVIVTANADTSKNKNFWIKLRNCGNVCAGDTSQPPLSGGTSYEECRQGVLSYDQVAAIPTQSDADPFNTLCLDEDIAGLVPVVPRVITGVPSVLSGRDAFEGFQVIREADVDQPSVAHWSLNNFTFKINWSDPSLKNVLEDTIDPVNYAPVWLNGTADDWKAFIIEGNWTNSAGNNTYAIPAAHPIHLHGHDFVVLRQESDPYDPSQNYSLNLNNPARRDVILLPKNGFIVIAFRLDNPGTWLIHCHIAWHASAGLALQFIERFDDIRTPYISPYEIVEPFYEQCSAWGGFYDHKCEFQGYVPLQDDSGI
ncbi:uncharacterized protein DFL_000211 [Arthrobotrys flagrans]|uniref:Multicopper oxidase n=1 Tax=Arthrobotrys flagrans TaxID=97331 RepID=A0A437AD35_ARTFL|nr:hypothetical protein DFL_000211 [Arthrobotrys flagrans]